VPQALDPKTIEDGAYRELLEMLENGERGTARYRFLRGSAAEMFSDNKATRINATTTVISKWSDEPALVPAVVRQARTDTANKSGIINSLVVLESVSPRRLRENDVAVSSLLDDVEKNGPQTAAYVDRLRSVLEPSRATRMSPR
jgi:hypothetical protein